jgi:hypothetical protein
MSSKLDDAPVSVPACGSGDGAGGRISQYSITRSAGLTHVRTGVADVRVRVSIIDMVERVIHVSPDFESEVFVKGKFLSDADVHVRKAGPN